MVPSIPSPILQSIEEHTTSTVRSFSFSSGGCINHGGKLITSTGTYFLKWNDLERFPGMFDAEARGLSLLRRADAIAVPKAIHVGTADRYQYLLLEHIHEGKRSPQYWEMFGAGLAAIHRKSEAQFGLDHDNYIGSLLQRNTRTSTWAGFFIHQRLEVQLQLARDQGRADSTLVKKFGALFTKLATMFPEEPPALLHGDLWGGNLMTDHAGAPCLIDPAVYYGHREADLAMTQLFGGFGAAFFDAYKEVYPLEKGYLQRFDVYNLYPLLVHVNLFGGGYTGQVVSILNHLV